MTRSSDRGDLASVLLLALAVLGPAARRPDPGATRVRQHPRLRARPRPGRHRARGPPASPANAKTAPVHHQDAGRGRLHGRRAAVRGQHADRPREDGQRRRHAAGRAARADRCSPATSTPSRSTSSGSSAPTTAARAPARCSSWRGCSRTGPSRASRSSSLFFDGEEAFGEWREPEPHLRQPPVRRPRRAPRARWPV